MTDKIFSRPYKSSTSTMDFVQSLSLELQEIRRFCIERKVKVGVAESVTSGLIQFLLSTMDNAGLFFNGGITTYSCEMKNTHLGISLDLCNQTFGVNKEITDTMAINICSQLDVQLGIAMTGFASAIPEEGIFEKIAFGSIVFQDKIIFSKKFESDREEQIDAQLDFAFQLIKECARSLSGLGLNDF
jgi:nicotinamide-nucleotide amidase